MLLASTAATAWHGAWIPSVVLGALAAQFTLRTAGDLGAAMAVVLRVLNAAKRKIEQPLAEPEAQTESAPTVNAATSRIARAGGRWA
ncbi:MAG: hypothetical protein DMG13_24195 [Acidobacteria bacterium]|nr:MAG: hypothetical protein DMG13_24195 [Acidobacteriota bacterium]